MLSYTPNGRRVITGGSNSAIRIYTVGEDGEPKTVDGADGHLAIAATVRYSQFCLPRDFGILGLAAYRFAQNDSFIMGAEDGTVWQYELETGKMDKQLVRCTLPVRDMSISKDGEWVAVGSE